MSEGHILPCGLLMMMLFSFIATFVALVTSCLCSPAVFYVLIGYFLPFTVFFTFFWCLAAPKGGGTPRRCSRKSRFSRAKHKFFVPPPVMNYLNVVRHMEGTMLALPTYLYMSLQQCVAHSAILATLSLARCTSFVLEFLYMFAMNLLELPLLPFTMILWWRDARGTSLLWKWRHMAALPLRPASWDDRPIAGTRPYAAEILYFRTNMTVPYMTAQSSPYWVGFEALGISTKHLQRFFGEMPPNDQKMLTQVLLYAACAVQCKSFAHFATTTALALNGTCEKGLLDVSTRALQTLCASEMRPEADEGVWSTFRSTVGGWKDARGSEVVKRLEKAMHVMVYAGIASKLGINYTEEEVVESGKTINHLKGPMDTLLFLAETIVHVGDCLAHYCSSEGSWRSLFLTSGHATDLDTRFNHLLTRQELYFNGSLEKVGSSDEAYMADLELCMREMEQLHRRGSSNPLEKANIAKKLERLSVLDTRVKLRLVDATIRVAPYVVKVFGPTCQGKSVATDEFQAHLLRTNGFPTDREFSVTINENDKFDSAIKSNTVCIRIDDCPKTRPDKSQVNPIDLLMRIANNELTPAVKAEIDQKGTVFFRNKLLMITTNIADLYASEYAAAPEAPMRRINAHIDFRVKEQFADKVGSGWHFSPSKYAAAKEANGGQLPDAHIYSIMQYCAQRNANDVNALQGNFTPLKFSWPSEFQAAPFNYPAVEVLADVGTNKVLHYLEVSSGRHFAHQAVLVATNDHHFKCTTCTVCRLPSLRCCCAIPPMLAESREEDEPPVEWAWLKWCRSKLADEKVHRRVVGTDHLRSWRARVAVCDAVLWCMSPVERMMCWLSTNISTWDRVTDIGWCWYYRARGTAVLCQVLITVVSTPVVVASTYIGIGVVLPLVACSAACWAVLVPAFHNCMTMASLEKVRAFGVRGFKSKLMPMLAGAGAIIAMWTVYRRMNPAAIDTNAEPDAEETVEWSARRRVDYWANGTESRALEGNILNMTQEQILSLVSRQTAHVVVRNGDKIRRANGLVVGTNLLLVNQHVITFQGEFDGRLDVLLGPPSHGGNMYNVPVSALSAEVVKGVGVPTDLALVHLRGGGSQFDMLKLMSTKLLPCSRRTLACTEVYRNPDGGVTTNDLSVQSVRVNHDLGTAIFALQESRRVGDPTFNGLCGAPQLTSEGGKFVVSGLHFLGDGVKGFGTQVTSQWLVVARDALLAKNESLAACVPRTMVPETFAGSTIGGGMQHQFTNELHFKACVNDMPLESSFVVLGGSTLPRVQPTSSVVPLPIRASVLEHCANIVETHGPPSRIRDPAIFAESLRPKVDCSNRLPDEAVLLAFKDLQQERRARFAHSSAIYPLSDMHILTGQAGRAGMKRMPLNTSMGLPWRKKKSSVMELTGEFVDGNETTILRSEHWDEFHRLDRLARGGNRLMLPFCATPKDEQVKIGKRKNRIMSSVNLYLSMMIRKYYLPLAHLELRDPFSSNIAVGVDAQGTDWDALARLVLCFGDDRVLACDYGEYDARMRYQIASAVFRLYIDTARQTGNYSALDLRAMEVIADEVCYCCMEHNGVFVELMQSFPSGHNMTVHTNCLGNLFLHMTTFYALVLERVKNGEPILEDMHVFRRHRPVFEDNDLQFSDLHAFCAQHLCGRRFDDFVCMLTYGDDMIGSVSPTVPWYNSMTISAFLSEYGYVYTNADKTAPTTPYQLFTDVDFLKRRFVFSAHHDSWVAPLAWSSITKRLLFGTPPKPSLGIGVEEHCATLIGVGPGQGALFEAHFHGRDVYDDLVAGMHKVVVDCRLIPFFEGNRLPTFCEQLAAWENRYEGWTDSDSLIVDAIQCIPEVEEYTYARVRAELPLSIRAAIITASEWNVHASRTYGAVVPRSSMPPTPPRGAKAIVMSNRFTPDLYYVFFVFRAPVHPEAFLMGCQRVFGPPVVILNPARVPGVRSHLEELLLARS